MKCINEHKIKERERARKIKCQVCKGTMMPITIHHCETVRPENCSSYNPPYIVARDIAGLECTKCGRQYEE